MNTKEQLELKLVDVGISITNSSSKQAVKNRASVLFTKKIIDYVDIMRRIDDSNIYIKQLDYWINDYYQNINKGK